MGGVLWGAHTSPVGSRTTTAQGQEVGHLRKAPRCARLADVDNLEQEVEGVDVDALGYGELSTLGEMAGSVSRGLSEELMARLPVLSFSALSERQRSGGSGLTAAERCDVLWWAAPTGLVGAACRRSQHTAPSPAHLQVLHLLVGL